MSKKIFLGFGLLFLCGSFVFISSASRDVYHSYLLQKNRTNEHLNHNQAILENRKVKETSQSDLPDYLQNMGARFLRDSAQRKKEAQEKRENLSFENVVKHPRRVFSARMAPWRQPLQRTSHVIFPEVDFSIGVDYLRTYENDTFSLQVPEGWEASVKDEHLFTNPYYDMMLQIKRFDVPCSNQTFLQCSINLSKDRSNRFEGGRLIHLSSVNRQHQFRNTIRDSRVQTETLTEGFKTLVEGKEVYMSRYFVSDLEGNVYLIEARFPFQNGARYLPLIKRVYDSFRIY